MIFQEWKSNHVTVLLKNFRCPGLSSKCRIHSTHVLGRPCSPHPAVCFVTPVFTEVCIPLILKVPLVPLDRVLPIHILLRQLSGEKSPTPPHTQFCWEMPSMCSPLLTSTVALTTVDIAFLPLVGKLLEWKASLFTSIFPVPEYSISYCCSCAFQETNSLRMTMQIVECSLLHRRAQGRVSS